MFINTIQNNKLLTKFLVNIFDYEDFYDFNYFFRVINNDFEIIIDLYDNVSENRFNRYVFNFSNDNNYLILENMEDGIFVKYINVLNLADNNDKLLKFGYLFKMDVSKMIMYASSFLDKEFVLILKEIIK